MKCLWIVGEVDLVGSWRFEKRDEEWVIERMGHFGERDKRRMWW